LSLRTKVSYETAWQLLHRLRIAITDPTVFVAGNLMLAVANIKTSRPYRDGGPRTRQAFFRRCGNHG